MSEFQYGFRPIHSAPNTTLDLVESIKLGFQKMKCTSLISLYIQGAYDNVSHQIPMDRLSRCESPQILWMKSFLSDRPLYTTDGQERNQGYWLTKGAPHGSSLFPLLFTLYLDDLLLSLNSSTETEATAYVDDPTIIATSKGVSDNVAKLEEILQRANVWAHDHQLKFSY